MADASKELYNLEIGGTKEEEVLSESEKLIWAAVYAAEWSRQLNARELLGISMSIPTCIENAWTAVIEAREAHNAVKEGWGEDDDVYLMLRQMTQ